MTFKEATQSYINPQGNITLKQNCIIDTDNNHLFNSTYVFICKKLSIIDQDFYNRYRSYINKCRVSFGLYNRSPQNNTRLISQDELIGICSSTINEHYYISKEGEMNFWFYNNLNPKKHTLASWQGRFLYTRAYYQLLTGVPFFHQLFWFIGIITCTKSDPGQTSTRCLYYLMSEKVEINGPWLMKLGMKIFKKHLTKTYGKLGELYGIYFGFTHPFSIYTMDIDF